MLFPFVVEITRGRVRAKPQPLTSRCDVTGSRDVISDVTIRFDSARPLSYRLPIVNKPLSPIVSESF